MQSYSVMYYKSFHNHSRLNILKIQISQSSQILGITYPYYILGLPPTYAAQNCYQKFTEPRIFVSINTKPVFKNRRSTWAEEEMKCCIWETYGWVQVKHSCWLFFQIFYALPIKRRTPRWTIGPRSLSKERKSFVWFCVSVTCLVSLQFAFAWSCFALLKKNSCLNFAHITFWYSPQF